MKEYKLTEKHKKLIPEHNKYWIDNALSTRRIKEEEKPIIKELIKELYRHGGLTPPPDNRIIFVLSPFIARFAGGFAAWIWYLRNRKINKKCTIATADATDAATDTATRAATNIATAAATYAATVDATRAATAAATADATDTATRAATNIATAAATYAATHAATSDATANATRAATADATYDATYTVTADATYDATRASTEAATDTATSAATYAATRDATDAATATATAAATSNATDAATYDATEAATYAATYTATHAATDAATYDAAKDATAAATDAATDAATAAATYAATYAATASATKAATADATRAATAAATADATRAATRDATEAATHAATDAATSDATYAATDAATYTATNIATDAATYAATYTAIYTATRAATDASTATATYDATAAATEDDINKKTWYYFKGGIKSIIKVAKKFGNVKNLIQCAELAYRMYQGGNFWSGTSSFIEFGRNIAKLNIDYSKWDCYKRLSELSSYRIMHKNFCLISERPTKLLVDNQNRPHCETGAFCEWADGSKLYSLHGIRVPMWLVETPAEKIDPKLALEEKNTDVQREIIRKIGYDRMLKACNAITVEKWTCPKTGLVYEMKHMKIGTINRKYLCYPHAAKRILEILISEFGCVEKLPDEYKYLIDLSKVYYAKCCPPEADTIIKMRAFQTGVFGFNPEEARENLLKNKLTDKQLLKELPEMVQ